MQIRFDLNKSWDTLDEAKDFFLDLVLELQALKQLPSPPTDLYVAVEGIELTDEQSDKLDIVLTN